MSSRETTAQTWKVIAGDCRKILPTLGKVDAVITDPPYGIGLQNNDASGHRSGWSGIAGDDDQTVGLAAIDWARERGVTIAAFSSPWKPWPGKWRNLIAWDKGGAVGGGGDIQTCLKRTWELLQVWNVSPMNGPRDESVWRHPMLPTDSRDHVCQKPVGLMCRIVERFTSPSAIVLDPFCGSGSTGVACVLTGRRFVGIELDPEHCETARRRLSEAAAHLFAGGAE